ncbi:MAG: hypothetical protein HKP42_01785 [Maribacter sp.]|nr:hypothetical protein [Maribacter sp.]
MRQFWILIISVFLINSSCKDRDDELNGIQIRVKNVSTINYDTIQVGDDGMVHENIGPGSYSDYLIYDSAYRYAYIAINSADETYVLQPIDFVGETPLPLGFYTYEIGLDTESNVTLNFVID